MKKIVSGSDAIINLELKDSNGNVLPLDSEEIIKEIEIGVYTKTSTSKILINDLKKLKDNHIKLQSEDLDNLERGQIYIDIYIVFHCTEFEDGHYDYRNKIATNLILV